MSLCYDRAPTQAHGRFYSHYFQAGILLIILPVSVQFFIFEVVKGAANE
jgi:hypothetical protein